jgi:hypothetical protein
LSYHPKFIVRRLSLVAKTGNQKRWAVPQRPEPGFDFFSSGNLHQKSPGPNKDRATISACAKLGEAEGRFRDYPLSSFAARMDDFCTKITIVSMIRGIRVAASGVTGLASR